MAAEKLKRKRHRQRGRSSFEDILKSCTPADREARLHSVEARAIFGERGCWERLRELDHQRLAVQRLVPSSTIFLDWWWKGEEWLPLERLGLSALNRISRAENFDGIGPIDARGFDPATRRLTSFPEISLSTARTAWGDATDASKPATRHPDPSTRSRRLLPSPNRATEDYFDQMSDEYAAFMAEFEAENRRHRRASSVTPAAMMSEGDTRQMSVRYDADARPIRTPREGRSPDSGDEPRDLQKRPTKLRRRDYIREVDLAIALKVSVMALRQHAPEWRLPPVTIIALGGDQRRRRRFYSVAKLQKWWEWRQTIADTGESYPQNEGGEPRSERPNDETGKSDTLVEEEYSLDGQTM